MLKRKILFYSTQSLKGWYGDSVIPHLKLLETQGDEVWWLNNIKGKRKTYFQAIRAVGTEPLKIYKAISTSPETFDWITKYKCSYPDWWAVYEALTVNFFEQFSALYLMGGLNFSGSNLYRFGNRVSRFPHDCGQLLFHSHSVHLISILMMLKAHHQYNIPIHEWMLDPLEMSLDLFHEDVRPKKNRHFLYHGYPIKKYHANRLDTYQFFCEKTSIQSKNKDKELDFVFGYTMLKKSGREEYQNYINDLVNEFPERRRRLFVRDDNSGKNTTVSKRDYLEFQQKARFTLVLPAYDKTQFSIFRFLEALRHDCLPILHPECNVAEIEKSFGVELKVLKDIPATEKARKEILAEMQEKFLKHRYSFKKT